MTCEIVGFEHIHLHSDYSLLDGYGTVEEYAKRAKKINQRFLCVSDHGAMGAVPRQIRACEEHGIDHIFACELYISPIQPELPPNTPMSEYMEGWSDENKKAMRKSYHLLAIAYNEIGYKNLVKLSSWGWTKGFYYKPRINHKILMEHKEGIIFTSCCYNSEIGQAFERGGEEAGEEMVKKYILMFGEYFRLEIMLLDFKKQRPYNVFIQKMAHKYGVETILTNDCHYCEPEDSNQQRLMLMIQTERTMQEIEQIVASGQSEDLFELQDKNLWMKSEEEINEKWTNDYSNIIDYDFFKIAKMNTVKICNFAKGVKLDRSNKLPCYPDADEKFKKLIMEGFERRGLPKTRQYIDRIKEEYSLICQKGFSSYFLIEQMMTNEARRWWACKTGGSGADAVGPGRGSAVGALICYCLGITDVDPIQHGLLFSRFLSPARGGKQIKLKFSNKTKIIDNK